MRDPRAQEILDNRRVLSEISKEEGLAYIMENSEYFLRVMREMYAWDYDREDFYETRFELITTQPHEEFRRIFTFLHLDINPGILDRIIEDNSFDRMKKQFKSRDQPPDVNHYRKGKAGDWINHLTDELKNNFKESYGDLLVRLNYAKDYNW